MNHLERREPNSGAKMIINRKASCAEEASYRLCPIRYSVKKN